MDESARSLISFVSRQLEDEEHNSPELIKTFISFHLFGLFGMLIVLATVLCSRSISRHSTWYSFVISWIISTTSYTLLFWGGNLIGPEPPYILCLMQGILIYSAPPLTAATTLALVIQIRFLLCSVITSTPSKAPRIPGILLTSLLVVPYLLYVTILIGTLVVGWRDPLIVRRVGSGMYCNFSNRVPGRVSTVLVALIMLPAVVLEVLICTALRRQWALFKSQPDALSMALRVVAFTFVGIFAIALSLVFFFTIDRASALNIVISIVPVSAVLIFGTQPDVLRVWMFWKKRPPPTTPEKQLEVEPTATPDSKFIVIDIHA
ncbi:hypothetical protein LshimejAT787_0601150 [Lyophyllum shimeji]|uniref:Uncharacterized protein n=1 Tax=Lyophyllum shimeji TaxID=47721 RepID=A0A9P3PN58_LYOSH|nr:hypothetical protein LshimejAT787_0601150 [Lyophyllum shimeji]